MSTLGDVIVDALQELLRILFSPVASVIEQYGPALLDAVVSTPHPNAVFTQPTNQGWPAIYDYYWDTIVPLSLFLWAASIGLVIFLESTSHLFGSYHRSKLKKRAFSGLLGILSWWWIAALSLQFTNALAGFLVPDLSTVSLFETLSFSAMGVLGLVVSLTVDLVLFLLIALIYFTRQVVLYLFVLLMPILIVLWIPGVGPFALVSNFMKRLAGFYVPFLFMTVPVALLFRLGELLGSSFDLSMSGIGAWLIALVIPVVAVASPFVLFWQAGAIFFVADRAAHHASRRRATERVYSAREKGQTADLGRRNFFRGVQGEPAKMRGGQYALGSGDSRAHAIGSRLNARGSQLRSSYQARRGGGGGRGGTTASAEATQSRDKPAPEPSRQDDFSSLRSHGRPPTPAGTNEPRRRPDDDRPNYIY